MRQFTLLPVLSLAFANGCFGGCMVYADFGNPQAAGDGVSGAYTTVRILDCKGKPRTSARISATAEGLVDGKRTSVPLRVEALVGSLSAIWWTEIPRVGAWVLHVRATNIGEYFIGGKDYETWSVLPQAGPDGRPKRALLLEEPVDAAQVDSTLEQMAISARLLDLPPRRRK